MNKSKKLVIYAMVLFFVALGLINYSYASDAYVIKGDTVQHNVTVISGADSATFEVLSEHMAKDKNYVYCGSSIIANADPGSMSTIGYIYAKDNKNVYYCDRNYSESQTIDGSDPATFEVLTFSYSKDKNAVYHEGCWNYYCTFTKTSIDPQTVVTVNADQGTIKDKNSVYTNDYSKIEGADADSFTVLSNSYYSKDKNGVYYLRCMRGGCSAEKLKNADPNSFEVFKEDAVYAMDKNNMYLGGEILAKQGHAITNGGSYNSLRGKIILKTEDKGEAYYISPNKKEMYFLSRPIIAFHVMREQGIGISNKDLEKIPVADNYCPGYDLGCDNTNAHNTTFANSQKGKIFLQVENNGEAWYINPSDSKRYFLGRPADAFNLMRKLGLGISNANYDNLIK